MPSGSNGYVSVVSWDLKKSKPDLIEGDKAEKHHHAAMSLNTTQKQGRMDCSGKEREKKKVKGNEKIDDLHPRARGKLHPNFSL